jgi:hypothetical protein
MFGNDRRAGHLETRLDTMAAGLPTIGPAADPFGGGWLASQAWGAQAPRLEVGWVADCAAGAHCYRVLTGPASYVWATPTSQSGFGVFGPRPVGTVTLGSEVLVLRHPQEAGLALIVAVLPNWSVHRGGQPADALWPFFRSGHAGDPVAHLTPVLVSGQAAAATPKRPAGVDVWDTAAGRPLDSTTAGEWGVIAETGVGVFADPFHAALRADEMTGVWAFYHDQLLRLAGLTVQRWSSTEEFESGDDNGELYEVRRTWTYPWEGHGLWWWNQVTPGRGRGVVVVPGEPVVPGRGQGDRRVPPASVQAGSGEAVLEPETFTQLPAARGYEFGGYLGQAGKRMTALPWQPVTSAEKAAAKQPIGLGADGTTYLLNNEGGVTQNPPPDTSYVETADRTAPPHQPGVLDVQTTLTGGYHLRSARRIVLAKRPSIPTPWQKRTPADPGGDAGGYTPSGLSRTPVEGAVPDPETGYTAADFSSHAVVADLEFPYGAPQRAAAVPDFLAYLFNWEGLHPFVYHAADWDLLDEGTGGLPRNQDPPAYEDLETKQYLDEPASIDLDVDHRYGASAYYESEAVVALLDDGQVYVHDGWGTQLLLHNGSITATCAGDFNVRAGRNFNVWAGDDINLRARTSVDITAAKRDVRVKAENSVHVLGGNGGCGGVLLESQAVCPAHEYTRPGEDAVTSGITMIAPRSAVYAQSPDFVFESPLADGRFFAHMGSEGVVRHAGRVHHALVTPGGIRADLFQDNFAELTTGSASAGVVFGCVSANEFAADYTLLGGALFVNGGGLFTSDLAVRGAVAATGAIGRVATAAVDAAVGSSFNRLSYATLLACSAAADAATGPPRAAAAEFTLRTDAQMRTTGIYDIWEARWQAIARLDNQTMPSWSEPAVVGRVTGYANRPHPGGIWMKTTAYVVQPFSLVLPGSGWIAAGRKDGSGAVRDVYSDPVVEEPDYRQPQAAYTVSVPIG